jgi:hypothetical protein
MFTLDGLGLRLGSLDIGSWGLTAIALRLPGCRGLQAITLHALPQSVNRPLLDVLCIKRCDGPLRY